MKQVDAKRTARLALLAMFLIGITAFTTSTFAAANDKAEKQGDFIRGVGLWSNACVRCHNMRDPNQLTDKQWKVVVSHMRVRAGLTGQDARDILAFLQQSNAAKDEK